MFLFLAICIQLLMADVPQNFRVTLERDVSSILCIPGHFRVGPFDWESTIQASIVMDDNSGQPDGFGEGTYFVVEEDVIAGDRRQALLDVSNMGRNGIPFSLSYNATMTRDVDSIIYLNSPDGSESLIMNPTNVTWFADSESISYARMQRDNFVYASTRLSTMNGNDTHLAPLAIRLNDQHGSKVSANTFLFLTSAIRSHGGSPRVASVGGWEIHLENCYDRLIPVLPDLLYFLSSDSDNSSSNGIQIVFRPDDYLRRSDDSRVCNLDVDYDRNGMSLSLSDRLIRQIGGMHLDYSNSRIGFFDPL